jgi:hypothetical protein
MNFIRKSVWLALSGLLAMLIVGCGGDDGDSSPPAAPIGNISGTWTVTESGLTTNDSVNCPATADPPYPVTVAQTGNNVTINDGTTVSTGTISGSTLTWAGSSANPPGTDSVNGTGTIAAGCNSFTGSFNWSYSEPGFSCGGTGQISGTRTPAGSC